MGLNPSTADENLDDPTIRRCINFAKDWGYGGMYMGNIFAYRSTDPKNLKKVDDPIGEDNDKWLIDLQDTCDLVVLAWGTNGTLMDRNEQVIEMFETPHCLALSKDGHPKHPLYLKKDLKPILLNE